MNEQKNERNGRFDELSDCVLREWKTCLRWEKAKRQRTLRRFMLCGEGRVPRLREVVLPNPYSVMLPFFLHLGGRARFTLSRNAKTVLNRSL